MLLRKTTSVYFWIGKVLLTVRNHISVGKYMTYTDRFPRLGVQNTLQRNRRHLAFRKTNPFRIVRFNSSSITRIFKAMPEELIESLSVRLYMLRTRLSYRFQTLLMNRNLSRGTGASLFRSERDLRRRLRAAG